MLGAAGLFSAGVHFALEWTRGTAVFFGNEYEQVRAWVPPLVFAFVGFLLVALRLALTGRRKSRATAGH